MTTLRQAQPDYETYRLAEGIKVIRGARRSSCAGP